MLNHHTMKHKTTIVIDKDLVDVYLDDSHIASFTVVDL